MMPLFNDEKQRELCRQIEKYAEKWKVSYIDSIISICEANEIPIESVSKILTKPILEKIQQEGQELNFLPKTSKLPI